MPSTEKELEKLESENMSEKDMVDSLHFWGEKYTETTGVDHLKSLVSNKKNYEKISAHFCWKRTLKWKIHALIRKNFILEKYLRCSYESAVNSVI